MAPGVFQLTETVDGVLAHLAVLAVYDRGIERLRRLFGWLALACAPAVLFFLVNESLRDRTRLLGALGAVALAAVLVVRWRVYRRRDLDDRKLASMLRLLRVLRADIRRDEGVVVSADLRRYTALPAAMKQGAVSRYVDRWLVLMVRLADGNALRLVVTDHIKRKRKRKRTAERGSSSIALSLRLAKRYRPTEPIAAALTAGRAPAGLIVRQRQVTAGAGARPGAAAAVLRLRLRTSTAGGAAMVLADADVLLHALRWAYSAIAAARRAA